ncbi:unnamed protein product [Prunus armeniaca]
MKGNEEFSTKKVLSESNVKVVFHQMAVPVTPFSTWIIYPKRSALDHSTRLEHYNPMDRPSDRKRTSSSQLASDQLGIDLVPYYRRPMGRPNIYQYS